MNSQNVSSKGNIQFPMPTFASGKSKDVTDGFFKWAFCPGIKKVIRRLEKLALPEDWFFGEKSENSNLPILYNYFRYTFYKASKDNLIVFGKNRSGVGLSAFNTGLVRRGDYEPIYALFLQNLKKNIDNPPPWIFFGFLCGANNISKENQFFRPDCYTDINIHMLEKIPHRIDYYSGDLARSGFNINLAQEMCESMPFEHLIADNFDRYPVDFLNIQGIPSEVKEILYDSEKRKDPESKEIFNAAWENPLNSLWATTIQSIFKEAVRRAVKRVEWNRSTAVLTYYPVGNCMSYLLPLNLTGSPNDDFDLALVVNRTLSGAYRATTVLTLEMAFNDARLVNRPASDWLRQSKVNRQESEEADE